MVFPKFKKIVSGNKKKIIFGFTILAVVIGTAFLLPLLTFKEINPPDKISLYTISEKKNFKLNEELKFEFEYKHQEKKVLLAEVITFLTGEKDINIKTKITDFDRKVIENYESDTEYLGEGRFTVKLLPAKDFRPGKYHLTVEMEKDGKILGIQEQEFTWGVLAINVNKSIYLLGETAYLQMAALRDDGRTLCGANLKLEITSPGGGLSSVTVEKSDECGPDNVTNVPDYFAYYQVGEIGIYQMTLTNLDTGYEISDSFEIREGVPFDVERIGPTRIYPPATYEMTLKIKANQDFTGKIIETVPASFEILNSKSEILNKFQIQNSNDQNEKQIVWQADWKASEIYELKYQFDAPDISPYLYLLGPLKIGDFQEIRQWQIAADATQAYYPSNYNLWASTTYVSGTTSTLQSNDDVYMTFRSYASASSTQTLYAHQETTTISGTSYYLLKLDSADAAGTNLSTSTAATGRQLWGKSVYPLTAVSSIPASTWTLYYRAWHSTPSTTTETRSPSSYPAAVWTNPTYAYANDTNFANAGAQDSDQTYTGYGFSLPANASVTLVRVRLDAKSTTNDGIKLSVSTDGGSSWLATTWTQSPLPTTETTYWVDVTDWTTWNTTKVNNIATQVIEVKIAPEDDVWLDWIPVEVTYTLMPVVHADVDILIRQSDGTIRQTIATNTANSGDLSTTTLTLSGTSSWPGYTVVDQTDYLEVDYYCEVTTAISGMTAYLRMDDSGLATADQTRITNVILPSEFTSEVEFTGTSNTESWTQLIWTIDSSFTTTSVTTMLQSYNYQTGQYATSGDGYMTDTIGTTDVTKDQTITTNPTYFRDASGNWKIKVKGVKATPTQFDWKGDLVKYEVTWEIGITVSGIAKEYDQTASTTSGTVRVAVDGTLQSATGTISNGSWSISSVIATTSGNVITVWVDGAATSNRAVAVTKYDGTGDIGGMLLYKRHLSIGNDDNQTITNTNLSQYDNSISGNPDIFHDISGTTLTVDTNNYFTDEELYIKSGNIFAPDGNINTHDIEIQGTFTASGTEQHNLSGGWLNNGTFTAASSTIQFTSTSTGETITTAGPSFYNLTFNGSNGEWTLQDALDVNNNLNLTAGTLIASSQNINIAGDLTLASGGLFNKGTSTTTFDGTGTNTWTDNNATKQDMGIVVIDGSSKTINLGSDVKTTKLTIGSNNTFGAGSYAFTITGSGTGASRPFLINSVGTFNASTSLAEFTATSTTDIESTTYYNLKLNQTGTTFQLYNNVTTTNDINIAAGNLDVVVANYNLVIGGNWTNTGIFTAQSGTVTFNATSIGKTINPGFSSFYTLTFNGSGGGWALTADTTTTNNFTISQGTVTSTTGTLAVGGNYNVSGGTFNHNTGKVLFNAFSAKTITTGGTTNAFYDIEFNGSGGWTFAAATNHDVDNNFTISQGTVTSTTGTLYVGGSWLVQSGETFNATSGTVVFDAGSTGKTITTGGSLFWNLTFNGSGGIWTFQDDATTTNNFTINDGTVTAPSSGKLYIGNNYNNAGGVFTHNNSTVVFNAGDADNTLVGTMTGTSTFYNLTFSNSGGSWSFSNNASTTNNFTMTAANTVTAPSLMSVGNDFAISQGTFTAPSNNLTIKGNFSNSGTFNHNSGTVIFDGTASATLTSGCTDVDDCPNADYYNVTINKTAAGEADDNLTLSTNHLRITNTLTITDGELVQGNLNIRADGSSAVSVGSNGKWTNIGTGDLKLGGTFTNNGTIDFDANDAGCTDGGGSDDILIRSTSDGVQRSWTGTSTITMYNVNVQDQGGDLSITVYSGISVSGNDTNWIFLTCPGPVIFGKGRGAYQMEIDNNLNVTCYINNTELVTTQITGGWHHIVLAYNKNAGGAEKIKLYVDGVKVDSADYSIAISPNETNLKIGDFVSGKIDEVKIYNRTLSLNEILQNYNASKRTIINPKQEGKTIIGH